MQELTNDNYSETKFYSINSILNIRPLNLVLIKKNQQLHSRSQYWNDNEAAPANGGFVRKARFILLTPSVSDKYCRRRLRPSLSRADQTKKYERSSVVADICQRMS